MSLESNREDKRAKLLIASACTALVISTGFAAAYNAFQMNNVRYLNAPLPLPTQLFSDCAGLGVALPVLFLLAGITLYRKTTNSIFIEGLAHAGYLASFAWALLAVWAWFLPHVLVGSGRAP